MLMCMIVAKNFFISCSETMPQCKYRFGWQTALLLLFVYLLLCILVCSFCISLNISGLKNISNISQGELSWVIWQFLFIPGTLENSGFWTEWICSFHPISKSVFVHLGRALHILFVPLWGISWTTFSSSLSLLLLPPPPLKGEFTLHISLSGSSLNYHHLSQNHSQFHKFYQFR